MDKQYPQIEVMIGGETTIRAEPQTLMPYSEFRFYSPVMDCEVIRLSMPGKQPGTEYFRIIPASDGRRYRERRDEALDLIELAIRSGLEPGEVLPA